MKIKCIYCDKPLYIKAGDNPGKNDPQVENRGFFDNFYNGTVWDSCYVEKKDRSEMIDQYLNKYKKNYPGKKRVPELLEDDVGISDVVKTSGVIKKTYAFYKCPHCQRTFFKSLNTANMQKLNHEDPSSTDYQHLDNEREFGTSSVDRTGASPYSKPNDFNRGNAAVDSDKKPLKKKYKFKR